jgi:hypothetical protein
MGVVTGDDDLDILQLKESPTLFYQRLLMFLSEDDAIGVVLELADICNRCWNADAEGCDCDKRG